MTTANGTEPASTGSQVPSDVYADDEGSNAYTEHLSAVNNVKDVLAADDIVNEHGIVLLKKGQRITKDMVDRIVQHKLLRPIEDSVAISDSLNASKLIYLIEERLRSKSERQQYEQYGIRAALDHCCAFFFRFPILVQKLTVMAVQMPQEFDKGIVVAYYSQIVSSLLSLPADSRAHVFVAALMHDVGMLHISRTITEKYGNLTPMEWRAIKSHVIIGRKIMEQSKGLPPIIGRAIMEHHEMSDGTGYPCGLFQQELCVEGQIVAMLDAIYAINLYKLTPKKIGTRALVPILQINSLAYHQVVSNAVIQVLRNYDHGTSPAFAGHDIRGDIACQAERLSNYYEKISTITTLLENHIEIRQVRAAFTMLEHMNTLLRSSGLLDAKYTSDLKHRADFAAPEIDIEDFYVMLQELQWQLVKLTRNLHALVDHDKSLPEADGRAIAQALKGLPELGAR